MSKDSFKVEHQTVFGPVAAIVVTLFAYFGSQLMGGAVVGLVAGVMRYDEARIKVAFESSTIWQFSFMLIVEVITLLILWWFMRVRKITLKVIGLGRRPIPKDIAYGLFTFGIYFVLLIIILAIAAAFIPGIDLDQKQQLGFESTTGYGPLALVFIALVVLPPIVEEIMIRGFLYTGLRSAMPFFIAATTTSLIFAVAHLQLGSGAPPLWVAAIDTFVLSMILIKLREKTGALWSGMLVHALKNSLAFISLFILHL